MIGESYGWRGAIREIEEGRWERGREIDTCTRNIIIE